jgi:hypothetical protein
MGMLREKFLTTWTPFTKHGSTFRADKRTYRVTQVRTGHHVVSRGKKGIVWKPTQTVYQACQDGRRDELIDCDTEDSSAVAPGGHVIESNPIHASKLIRMGNEVLGGA